MILLLFRAKVGSLPIMTGILWRTVSPCLMMTILMLGCRPIMNTFLLSWIDLIVDGMMWSFLESYSIVMGSDNC